MGYTPLWKRWQMRDKSPHLSHPGPSSERGAGRESGNGPDNLFHGSRSPTDLSIAQQPKIKPAVGESTVQYSIHAGGNKQRRPNIQEMALSPARLKAPGLLGLAKSAGCCLHKLWSRRTARESTTATTPMS